MNRLDLALRSAGAIVLMQRARAEVEVARAFEPRPGRSMTRRMLHAVGLAGEEDAPGAPPDTHPCARVSWAATQEERAGYMLVGDVAVIDVSGIMTPDGYYDWWEDCWVGGYVGIGAAVAAARGDEQVAGIILHLNTPGGLVDGCFELCEQIRAGSARHGGKPIWAAARMAYSAGYAIASACDRIVAARTAGVGSVGVVVLHTEMSGMLAEWGIKVEAIESAPHKTDGAWFKPLSDDARADLQAEVDEIAKIFVAAVEAGRGITADAIRAQEARCYLAQHSDPERSGLALGLVDAIGHGAEVADALRAEIAQSASPAGIGGSNAAGRRSIQEDDMGVKATLAAILGGNGTAASKLAAVKKLAEEDEEEASGAEKEEEQAEGDKEEEAEGDEDEKAEGEGDDEGEAEEEKDAPAAKAFAVLDLPEARGRDDLAKALARTVAAGRMSVKEAKGLLAAAPKASRLSDRMQGRDIGAGRDAAGGKGSGLGSAVDRMVEKMKGSKAA